jgi:hypothetical protein
MVLRRGKAQAGWKSGPTSCPLAALRQSSRDDQLKLVVFGAEIRGVGYARRLFQTRNHHPMLKFAPLFFLTVPFAYPIAQEWSGPVGMGS